LNIKKIKNEGEYKMKILKTISILLLLLITGSIYIQAQLFLTIQPSFFELGSAYNYEFNKLGIYSTLNYGHVLEQPKHVSLSVGLSFKFEDYSILSGVKKNYFNEYFSLVDPYNSEEFSIEAGLIIHEKKLGRISLIFITNLFHLNTRLGIGYKL
jgi:hypothetical protein